MARPRKKNGEEATAERLVRAAEREFAARGFAAARLEDIAAQVGLTRPSLLHHYATKEALYVAVLEAFFARIRGSLLGGMASRGTFLERLDAIAGGFAEELLEDPVPAQLLARELQDAKGPGERLLREQVVPLLELVEAFVRHGGRGVVPESVEVRGAIVDFAGAVIFCAIAGPVRAPLWNVPEAAGPQRDALREHFVELARRLLDVDIRPPPRRTRSAP